MTWFTVYFTKRLFLSSDSWSRSGRRRPNIRRPMRIELLENRCVPTIITPTTFADGGLGSGSLRDAVLQFNADPGSDDDIIQLETGTYALTIRNRGGHHETAGLEGDLNINNTSHRWIIQGAGSSGDNATIIDAGQLRDRVFQIVNPGTQVVFQDVVIQGGRALDDGSDGALAGTTDALGGGILNNGGDVTLDNVVVQNNVAQGGDAAVLSTPGHNASGGGIYSTGGALTVAGPTISNNQAIGGRGGDHNGANYAGNGGAATGGGLYATGGSLDISDGMIANNRATGGRGGDGFATYTCTVDFCYTHNYGGYGGAGQGGGLYVNRGSLTIETTAIATNEGIGGSGGLYGYDRTGQGGGLYSGGTLTVSNSALFGNTAADGGGIVNLGTLTVSNSTLSGNTALDGDGGGISNRGTLTVSTSTLSGNFTSGFYALGGGIYNYRGTLTVSDSTLSGNTATYNGGGIDNDDYGTLTVTNSTLSGNTASVSGGGIDSLGTLTVSNSTLSGNTATNYYGGGISTVSCFEPVTLTNITLTGNRANSGGGLYVYSGSPVLHNVLIADNFRGTGTTRDDVYGHLDPGGDYNLIGDGTGMTGLRDGVNGNQVGSADAPIDPLLGPLADNGGPTLTHALLSGSPALDAGNNAYATAWDQRGDGYPRIVNGIIDIGAFEYQGDGSGPSTSRSSRGRQTRLAELVAALPPAVSQPPALSPGQGSTITGEGPFVAPLEAASALAVASVDPYFATVFEDRGEHTTAGWGDLEPAAIGWLPVLERFTIGLRRV